MEEQDVIKLHAEEGPHELSAQITKDERFSLIKITIRTDSYEAVAKVIELLDLDSVDIFSHEGRDKIKPRGYVLEEMPAPYYDKLVKISFYSTQMRKTP